MYAIITDREFKTTSIIKNVYSAVTHKDYIAIHFTREEGLKDVDVFNYKYAEILIMAE